MLKLVSKKTIGINVGFSKSKSMLAMQPLLHQNYQLSKGTKGQEIVSKY